MKVSFSLKGKAAPSTSTAQAALFTSDAGTSAGTTTAPGIGVAPPLHQFTDDGLDADADSTLDAAPTASSSSSSRRNLDANRALAAQAAGFDQRNGNNGKIKLSRAAQKRMEAERRVDATVYEYDEVWDAMQVFKTKKNLEKEIEAVERKPKYISSLLQSATQRKLDRLRAEEKAIQRERETEGDEFADKEQFVTQAYRDQMAAVRAAEEEEKRREEMEKAKRRGMPSTGMTHFYRQLLEQSEAQHEETVAATVTTATATSTSVESVPRVTTKRKVPMGPQNLTITRPPAEGEAGTSIDSPEAALFLEQEQRPESDRERAARAWAEGKQVELNDEGQIVDNRDLLSAGLNLFAPDSRRSGLAAILAKRKASTLGAGGAAEEQKQEPVHRAVGLAASRREIEERRRREVEVQFAEEAERMKKEKQEKQEEAERRAVAKRNMEEDVKNARERYLERKRRRIEEEARAQAQAEGEKQEAKAEAGT